MSRISLWTGLLIACATAYLAGPRSIHAQGWQAAPAFPAASPDAGRLYAVGLNHQGRLVAVGGQPFLGQDSNGSVHFLDAPYSGAWQDGGVLEGVGPINQQGGGIDNLGRMIVFAGWDPNDDYAPGSTVAYDLADPNNTEGLAPLPAGVPWINIAYATDDQHRVYCIGGGPGRTASGADPNLATCVRYLGTLDHWETAAPMPSGVADAAAVNDGRGHILVIGGYSALGSRTANVAQYEVASNTWSDTALPDLPAATSGLRAVRGGNGLIYAIGGRQGAGTSVGTVVNTVYVLDLDTSAWSMGPAMLLPREHFGAALGDDDYIYVMGYGGSSSEEQRRCEKLYTPVCPQIDPPPDTTTWAGMTVELAAAVSGGSPLTYQWRKDGVDLADGPAAGGGTLSGAQTTTLVITSPAPPDEGDYDLVATNPCGSTTSAAVFLTVRVPPAIPADWEVINLHPAWALRSQAADVDGGSVVGIGGLDAGGYTNLDQPILWTAYAPETAVNLTPAGSVGGACTAAGGGRQVGWWWWPYQCYVSGQWYTCYSRQACEWAGSAASHNNLQVSGWEYSVVSDTDGTTHVGTVTTDDDVGNYYSRATVWGPPSYYGALIHPAGVSNSFLSAVSDGRQFGSIHTPYPGPQVHAAMWSGTAASFIDMNPPGHSTSGIAGAGDGQAVGSVDGYTVSHAALWGYGPDSFQDLHPAGAASSSLLDCQEGLQVGTASIGGQTHAGIWSGTAEGFFDLHPFVPAEFLTSSAAALEIDPAGDLVVVGSGYNSVTGRQEALLWRPVPSVMPGDLDGDGDVDLVDYAGWFDCLSGPQVTAPPAGCDPADFSAADLDSDADVDLDDGAAFARSLGEP